MKKLITILRLVLIFSAPIFASVLFVKQHVIIDVIGGRAGTDPTRARQHHQQHRGRNSQSQRRNEADKDKTFVSHVISEG